MRPEYRDVLIQRIATVFPTIAMDFRAKFEKIEHDKMDLEVKLWDTIEAYDLQIVEED